MKTDGVIWKTNVGASTWAQRDKPGKTLFSTSACSLCMIAHPIPNSYRMNEVKASDGRALVMSSVTHLQFKHFCSLYM